MTAKNFAGENVGMDDMSTGGHEANRGKFLPISKKKSICPNYQNILPEL